MYSRKLVKEIPIVFWVLIFGNKAESNFQKVFRSNGSWAAGKATEGGVWTEKGRLIGRHPRASLRHIFVAAQVARHGASGASRAATPFWKLSSWKRLLNKRESVNCARKKGEQSVRPYCPWSGGISLPRRRTIFYFYWESGNGKVIGTLGRVYCLPLLPTLIPLNSLSFLFSYTSST